MMASAMAFKYKENSFLRQIQVFLNQWRRVSNRLRQKSTERSKQCGKNSFKQIERDEAYVSIHWWYISHYKNAFFQF